jgi:ATP-dependent exoDNAse (exonuclease V) beta subunit
VERPRWDRARRDLLGAQISTIHAFCARVVRENPLESGIDPRAVVLDEHESRAYLEGVVEEELTVRVRAGDRAARDLVQRSGLRTGREGGAVGLCLRFLGRLAVIGRDGAWLVEATARQETLRPDAVAKMQAAAQRIDAKLSKRLQEGGAKKGWAPLREAWPECQAMLARVGPATTAEELTALADLIAGARLGSEVKADLVREGGRLGGVLAEEHGFLAALPTEAGLAHLVAGVAEAVAGRKRADGVLTFDDLIAETRNLLEQHSGVLARYARRFRAVLVDEFQDTDAVQAGVIQRLVSGAPDIALFVVGDEKQSIYRFRGADVTVFAQVKNALGTELPLGTNFRSQPAVLEFVNALAAHTLQVPADALDAGHWTAFDASQRLVPDRAPVSTDPAVRLVTLVAEHAASGLKVGAVRELEGRVLAGVIADLHDERSVAYGDVAVLFRSLNQVKAYEYALRRRAIPYYVVKGRGFFQCQEVRDVAALLGAVADPYDAIALAAALRSPFFALDDDTLWRLARVPGVDKPDLARRFRPRASFADIPERAADLEAIRDLLARLRRLRSRATIAELLETALAATDFEAVCLTQFQGMQKVANVRKVIELGRDVERRRRFTLRDFVRLLRDLEAREPREPEAPLVGEQGDVVRLMTIHQAKGLEFPVVVLVDMGRELERDNTTLVLDEALGVVAAPADGAGLHPLRQGRLEEHRARERDRSRAEHARLLYVACTRARDTLVLLEGKGDVRYLREGKGDAYVWCHQVWDLLGREAVSAFVESGAPSTTLAVPGGGSVLVERADRYRARGSADAPLPTPREAPATAVEVELVDRVVGFVPPVPGEVVTSPTALADFRRCPRQYWYRHVLGVVEPGRGGVRGRRLGLAAHDVLETLDLERASDDDVVRALAGSAHAVELRPRERMALAADLAAAVAAVQAEMAAGLEIVGREVPFVLPLPGGSTPRVFLEGRIDLLVRRRGALVVRDYKYTAPSAEAVAQHAAQLVAYRLAVAGPGEAAADGELVFLRGGPAVVPLPAVDRMREEATTVEAALALGAAQARADADAFPRRPPGPAACEALGCGYVRWCWGAVSTGTGPDRRIDTGAA